MLPVANLITLKKEETEKNSFSCVFFLVCFFFIYHPWYVCNIEIEVDKNRTWCPRAGCETVCLVEPKPKDKNGIAGQSGSLMSLSPVAVKCPTCVEEFCSSCKKAVIIRNKKKQTVLFYEMKNKIISYEEEKKIPGNLKTNSTKKAIIQNEEKKNKNFNSKHKKNPLNEQKTKYIKKRNKTNLKVK